MLPIFENMPCVLTARSHGHTSGPFSHCLGLFLVLFHELHPPVFPIISMARDVHPPAPVFGDDDIC